MSVDERECSQHMMLEEQHQYEDEFSTSKKSMDIYRVINAIQGELCKDGISKGQKNQQQDYKFRGIDDIYNALAPLLSAHGLSILPRVLSRSCSERQTIKGGTLFTVVVEVEFDFIASSDGSKHTIKIFGEAQDSGDKATNKAMSSAYKYAAIQAFCIPTEGDNDADASTHTAIFSAVNVIKDCNTLEDLEVKFKKLYKEADDVGKKELIEAKDYTKSSIIKRSSFI